MITIAQIKTACAAADYQSLHDYNARMRAGEALELCDTEDVRVHMQLNIKTAALCQDATITRQLVSACDALLRGAAHPFDDQQHNALIEADAAIASMQLSPFARGQQ